MTDGFLHLRDLVRASCLIHQAGNTCGSRGEGTLLWALEATARPRGSANLATEDRIGLFVFLFLFTTLLRIWRGGAISPIGARAPVWRLVLLLILLGLLSCRLVLHRRCLGLLMAERALIATSTPTFGVELTGNGFPPLLVLGLIPVTALTAASPTASSFG